MKKQIFFLSALLALGFSGCSDKENIETGNSEEIRVAVTFDIGTNTRAVNDLFLGQVTLYVFNEETEAYVSTQETQIEGGTITFPGKGSYIVEAIANERITCKDCKITKTSRAELPFMTMLRKIAFKCAGYRRQR